MAFKGLCALVYYPWIFKAISQPVCGFPAYLHQGLITPLCNFAPNLPGFLINVFHCGPPYCLLLFVFMFVCFHVQGIQHINSLCQALFRVILFYLYLIIYTFLSDLYFSQFFIYTLLYRRNLFNLLIYLDIFHIFQGFNRL